MKAIDRLALFHEYLKKENKFGGRNVFERRIGKSEGYLSNAVKKRSEISSDLVANIVKEFPILNANWLLTGEGSMLKPENLESNAEIIHLNNIPEPKPHIDASYADCGVPNGFSMAIKASDCELVSVPFISANYDFSIRARGDSMINRSNPSRSIKDKDIILCKLWKSRSYLKWGEVYALATIDGVIIKKVLPVEGDITKIVCESFNKEDNFPNFTLSVDDVLDWATVEGVFSINKW